MDDRNIRKIKAMGSFINFYKGFFFISSIATVIISLIIKSLFAEDKYFLNTFSDNWNTKPVVDVDFTSLECQSGYEKSNLGFWPLSSNLCDCTDSFFFTKKNKKRVIKPYPCTLMLNLIGCKNTEEMKRMNINRWKGRRVCVKRQVETYMENLLNHADKEDCKCKLIDSMNKKQCSKECPKSNEDVSKKVEQQMNSRQKENNRMKKQTFINRRIGEQKNNNYTTFDDMEMIYNKNFNVTFNNEVVKEYAISDIVLTEHYPCLIPNDYSKINEAGHLFDYILENIDLIKNNTVRRLKEETPLAKSISRDSIFQQINLQNLDKKECFFYENSYFDRRHYVLDVINFDQFLLHDLNTNNLLYSDMSLTYDDMTRIYTFTPTTTLFLISSPFYGWNLKICRENPLIRMKDVISLYDSASVDINIVVILKLVCFFYLFVNGIFEKVFDEYHFALYTRNPKNTIINNNYQMVFDIIYYIIKIVSVCCLIKICFTLKNLTSFHYLHIIRNDCVDENSTKVFTYLYDICEEKFIYCVFIMTFNMLEFIFFTIIFKNSYDLKLTLGS